MSAAYLNGLHDPRAKAILNSPYVRSSPPAEIEIPIAELLGSDGHEHCEGFELAGSADPARADRKLWAKERQNWQAQHGDLTGFTSEPPPVERIPSFGDGLIVFRFSRNPAGDGYLVNTHFPAPQDN